MAVRAALPAPDTRDRLDAVVRVSGEGDLFERERWTLVLEFDDLGEQYSRDGENVFPNDEASRTVSHIVRCWNLLPEDIPTCVRWTDTRVECTADLIDHFADVLEWVLLDSLPRRIELSRV